MKKHLLVFLAAFSAFMAMAQTEKTDRENYNLKGKVKSVTETVYEAESKFGEVVKGNKTDRYYREYNSAGMETQYIQENFGEEKDDYEKFIRTTKYESNKAVEMKEEEDGEVQISRTKYNQQGLPEVLDALDKKGNLLARQKNKYNADGLLIQADSYLADGSLEMKAINTYNAKKQVVKEEWSDEDGKPTRLFTYVYDSRGNLVEKASTNYSEKNPKPFITKYVYNDKGQKTEERNSISGLDKKTVFEYNAQGDEIRKLDEYGTEEKHVYTYDTQNNWVKRVTTTRSRDETKYETRERQIKYH